MWIILLDQSSSMGEQFEESKPTSSRTRLVRAQVKFEAAKEVLREELVELKVTDPGLMVAIFAFTKVAKLAYEGPVAELAAIENALAILEPNDGTDIAAAFDAAADYKEAKGDTALSQLVLISDGKSDRVQAMAAARRCLERQLALSMWLIDPTEEGKAFAREVVRSVGGTYQPVMNYKDMQEATRRVSHSHAVAAARAEQYFKAADCEARSIKESVADQEQVQFTSAYPGRITRGNDYPLRVYLHLENQAQEVRARLERITDQLGPYPRKGDAQPNQRIPIGTRLEVAPRIHHVDAVPLLQPVTWTGVVEELSFRIHYSGPENTPPPCSGFIDISAAGLLLAQIPVSIQVEAGEARIERRSADMISRVFASYSHKDELIVRACKEAYRALGIQLFIDKDEILGGQLWRDVLRRSIGNHDLFQLFWSQSAADSDEVGNEWKLAKEIAPTRSNDFIRPVYWTEEPKPQPPQELADLHFSRLDLKSLQLPSCESAAGDVRRTSNTCSAARFEASFPVVPTVHADLKWAVWLQERMTKVVPFVEELIGVRYFPPVTFLVDEHTVRAAREVLTIDRRDDCEHNEDVVGHSLAILRALALAFHVGKLNGPETRWDERESFFDIHRTESRADYHHVVRMAEGGFTSAIRDHFAGKDVLTESRRSLNQVLDAVVGGKHAYYAPEMVLQTLEKACPEERARLSNVATANVIEELKSSTDGKRIAAAALLLATDLPQLAARYGVLEFFGSIEPNSLRNHKTFPEYLKDFVLHWLAYVKVAASKRPNAIIDVGFSAPSHALKWIRRTFSDIEVRVTHTDSNNREQTPECCFEMPIGSYQRCVERLSDLLLSPTFKGIGGQITKIVGAMVSTHGIYLPESASAAHSQLVNSLTNRGWPADAALPGQHKVLLCMGAIERLKEQLVGVGRTSHEAESLAKQFSLSVLVHEHFHAAVATGLDQFGRTALGTEHAERWKAASPLNESLAVWCERHFFRSDRVMLEQIDGYIGAGAYPDWPYKGGEVVESFYVTAGTPEVRRWIRHLRDDPENAQREFDERVSQAIGNRQILHA